MARQWISGAAPLPKNRAHFRQHDLVSNMGCQELRVCYVFCIEQECLTPLFHRIERAVHYIMEAQGALSPFLLKSLEIEGVVLQATTRSGPIRMTDFYLKALI